MKWAAAIQLVVCGLVMGLTVGAVVSAREIRDAKFVLVGKLAEVDAEKAKAMRFVDKALEAMREADAQVQGYYLKAEVNESIANYWRDGFNQEHKRRLECERK